MDFKQKRTLTFTVVGLYLFLGGCEYAIIFPTIWDYLQSLGVQEEHWVGFVVSAYSLTGAIAGIIGGRLADKYESRTKLIVLTSVFLTIIGSLQYALGYSPWNLMAARLICGSGTAATAALITEVCRATEVEERTPILSICNAARQVGILIGPGLQLIVHKIDFWVGSFHVTPLNGTGLFMASVWIIFCIYAIFMFYDLTEGIQAMRKVREAILDPYTNSASSSSQAFVRSASRRSSVTSSDHNSITSDADNTSQYAYAPDFDAIACASSSSPNSDKEALISGNEEPFSSVSVSIEIGQSTGIPIISTFQRYTNEFLTDKFVVLVGMASTLLFAQMAIEAVIPVVMQTYFNLGIFENSLVYMVGGLEALVVSVLLIFISRRVRDTTLLIIGWTCMILIQLWLLVIMPYFEAGKADKTDLICYMAGIVMLFMIYPISFTSITGLFSKCLSHETQGLGQGIFRVFSYIGLVFGPIWGGASIKYTYWALGVPVSIMLINAVMFGFSYINLREVEIPKNLDSHEASITESNSKTTTNTTESNPNTD